MRSDRIASVVARECEIRLIDGLTRVKLDGALQCARAYHRECCARSRADDTDALTLVCNGSGYLALNFLELLDLQPFDAAVRCLDDGDPKRVLPLDSFAHLGHVAQLGEHESSDGIKISVVGELDVQGLVDFIDVT